MTNIIKLREHRQLTDKELRGALRLLMEANVSARQTVGSWLVSNKRPMRQELFNLANTLKSAEASIAMLASRPPTDGHALDSEIDAFGGAN
jgi:hypothetical protein